MSTLLLLETATEICSIGICQNGKIIALQEATHSNSHASNITLFIEACTKSAGISLQAIDAVAISQGPGSYTSLRIGVATAKGICYAMNKPLLAIDTLKSLAFAARQNSNEKNALFCPMIDARRMEVYTAMYDFNMNEINAAEAQILDENSFQDLFEQGKQIYFCGNGAEKASSVIQHEAAHFSEQVICSAKNLAQLATQAFEQQNFADLAYFEPNYFKLPNITAPKQIL